MAASNPGAAGRRMKADQTACKPGSVPPAQGADAAAIPLDRPLLGGSRDPPGRLGPATALPQDLSPGRGAPIRSCSRRGLPCRPGHPVRGGLLPHPFTLAPRAEARRGGLLSVALSLGSPPAGVTRRLVAVEPGLSSPPSEDGRAAARPSGPPRRWALRVKGSRDRGGPGLSGRREAVRRSRAPCSAAAMAGD